MEPLETQPSQTLSDKLKAQINLVWEMGSASLVANQNRLLLTKSVFDSIGIQGIEILKARLSMMLGGIPIVSQVDQSHKVLGLIPDPTYIVASTPSSQQLTPESFDEGPLPKSMSRTSPSKLRAYGKKSKIPRPPNAFILYRQHHHPTIKSHYPNMHNNEISIKLGQQWKHEPLEVKDKYRELANSMKERHAAQHPGYQYAPRKPGEKKRRMTTRKIKQVREAHIDQELSEFPSPTSITNKELMSTFKPVVSCNYGQSTIGDYANLGDIDNYNMYHPLATNTDIQNLDQANGSTSFSLPNTSTDIQTVLEELMGDYQDESAPNGSNLGWDQTSFMNPPELAADQDLLDSLIDWQGLAWAMGNVGNVLDVSHKHDANPSQEEVDAMIMVDKVHQKDVEAVQATGPNLAFQNQEEAIDTLKGFQSTSFPH